MRLHYDTDAEDTRAGITTRLGLLLLQTDAVIEGEFRSLLGFEGLAVHHSRVPNRNDISAENLARMEADIPAAARLLPPAVQFDAIGFACTSGATVIGEDRVAAAIHKARPGVATSNPLSAAKAALAALGLRRIGFVTPYVEEVSFAMRDRLAEAGVETVSFGSFEVADDAVVARMTPACILQAVLAVGRAEACDGVFVACTNLRAAGIVTAAEAELGRPVVTSNQALAWHLLRLAGNATPLPDRGKLFTLPLTG